MKELWAKIQNRPKGGTSPPYWPSGQYEFFREFEKAPLRVSIWGHLGTNQCPSGDLARELSFWGPFPKFGDSWHGLYGA